MGQAGWLRKFFFLITLVLVGYILLQIPSVVSWGPGPNYRNYSVRTTVNITEAYPEILNITCNAGQTIVLTAGTSTTVVCIVVVRDYNGGDTIVGDNGSGVFNSTFYYFQNKSDDPDDYNVHYSNQTCSLNGTPNGYYVNWSCAFHVLYFANNGTWRVNATVLDTHNSQNVTVFGVFNNTMGTLYALNVTEVIDYGSLVSGSTSPSPVEANVTNVGNVAINVTVAGFGGSNISQGAGLAMICDQRNLTVGNERFSLNSSAIFSSMTPLSSSAQMIANLTIQKQVQDGVYMVNSTYWSLYINTTDNPFGVCNGTIVFSAVAS
jgi:hypothetical protein